MAGGTYYTHCDLDGHPDKVLYVLSGENAGIRTKAWRQGARTKDRNNMNNSEQLLLSPGGILKWHLFLSRLPYKGE